MSRRRNVLRARAAVEDGRSRSSSRRGAAPAHSAPADPIEALIERSRRCRSRGDTRRAVVLLREACARDEWRARTWTLLGALLSALGRASEAASALEHARWLRERAGEQGRASSTRRLIEALNPLAA